VVGAMALMALALVMYGWRNRWFADYGTLRFPPA
jgi:hypothetical protein